MEHFQLIWRFIYKKGYLFKEKIMVPKFRYSLVVLVAIVGLLTLSACGTPIGSPPTPRTISVSGDATAYGKPDTAVAQVGVQTRNADAGAAVDENTNTMNAIMAALTGLGVAEEDIQTSNFSVYANQNYDTNGQPTDVVYIADNTVTVTVRDLTKLGDVLGQTVAAGANNIYGVSFTVSDQSALEADARAKAMADAKARADQLAQAAGVTLGAPVTITELSGGVIPYPHDVRAEDMAASGGAAVPVSGGQVSVQLHVTVTYAIQ
jgi:uncharacterized protein